MPKYNVNETLPVRTQFLIFTLFGEYVIQREGNIWTSDLLYLMGLLGVSERAVRSTLSRMSRKGWLVSQKFGRRSKYFLTARGRELLEQGSQRIFEPIFKNWDGQWHIVVYSLPEGKRKIRQALRQSLSWLGFGSVAPGTWISPRNRRSELNVIFKSLEVEQYVGVFSGGYLGPSSAQELVAQCWDLVGLETQYQDFFDCYHPEYIEAQRNEQVGQPMDPEESFVRRFWLTHEFQSFPLTDPNLPTDLLPSDWIGFAVRELFSNYRTLLGNYAEQFIDEVVGATRCVPEKQAQPVSLEIELQKE